MSFCITTNGGEKLPTDKPRFRMSERTVNWMRTWPPLVVAILGAAATYGMFREKLMRSEQRIDALEYKVESMKDLLVRIDERVQDIREQQRKLVK